MKKIFVLFLCLVFAFTLAGCTQNTGNNAEAVQKVKIAYLPINQALPLFVGIEKGYFKDKGLDVEAVKIDAPNLIVDALLAGEVDFGAPSTASGIVAISQQKKPDSLKIFALNGASFSVIGDVLIVKIDSNLKSIADLKGKKLGILPGIQFQTLAKHILKQNNLAEGDVQIVEIATTLQVQALAQGQIDAVLGLEPTRTIAIEQGIGKDLIFHPVEQYVSNPWYGGCGAINMDFAKRNPQTTQKVLDAFAEAIDFVNKHPEESRQYLKNYTVLDDELIKKVSLPIVKFYADFDSSDLDAYQKFVDLFYDEKVIDQKIDVKNLIFNKDMLGNYEN